MNNNLYEPLKKIPYIEVENSFGEKRFSDLLNSKKILFGFSFLFIVLLFAFIGPYITEYKYDQIQLPLKNSPPSKRFWFGTDDLGRDLFTRLWWGARISLSVGFFAAIIDLCIGVVWGCISGLSGGKIDELMMRICDCLYAIPYLLMVILLIVVIGPGYKTIIIALTFTGWINMARIMRGKILQIKSQEYVYAAKAFGASPFRLIFFHFIPNTAGNIITTVLFTIPHAIFTEAFLSFLGLGVQAPVASWGVLITDSISALRYYPWRLFFPSSVLTLSIFSFHLIGEGIKEQFKTN